MPVQPLFDFLNSDVPVISTIAQAVGLGNVTWLDLAEDGLGFLGDDGYSSPTTAAVLNMIAAVENLASILPKLAQDTFNINRETLLLQPTFALPAVSAATAISARLVPTPRLNLRKVRLRVTITPMAAKRRSTALSNVSSIGLQFPILDNPLSAVGILLGKNVDLVTWNLPSLSVGDSFNQLLGIIPIGPVPLGVGVFGSFTATFQASVGLDTSGLAAGNFLDGFYFKAQPLFSLDAEAGAYAGVDLFLVSAGIEAGLEANVSLDFSDIHHTGKVYLNDLESQCVLQESGSVDAFADLYFTIGFSIFSVTITIPISPPITLFSFSSTCATEHLAHVSAGTGEDAGIAPGTLILNVGPYSHDRQAGATDTGSGVAVSEPKPGVVEVQGFGTTQDYTNVSGIYARGGSVNDTIQLDSSVTLPTTLIAGSGHEALFGGGGDNSIVGGSGTDVLIGGNGNDTIVGGSGSATIQDGNGNDTISVHAGNNSIQVGDGNDSITGGTSNDTIYTGTGNDTITGGTGDDEIFGGGGNNIITATGSGTYLIEGGAGNNYITANQGSDLIYGNNPNAAPDTGGNDTIHGGGGNDTIYGGGGSNQIYGGSGSNLIYGNSPTGTGGNNTIYGGSGSDTIYGGGANNTIYGGSGNDLIFGGGQAAGGQNTIYGGTGSDTIYGGANGDQIYGGTGNSRATQSWEVPAMTLSMGVQGMKH